MKIDIEVKIAEIFTQCILTMVIYFQVTPIETEIRNDTIDIEVRIYEGLQARINRVSVSGNSKTNDHVIMRDTLNRVTYLVVQTLCVHKEKLQLWLL